MPYIEPNNVIIKDRKELHERAADLSEKLVMLLMSEPRNVAFLALGCAIPALWSNGSNLDTVTSAVDAWRRFSLGIELDIRDVFGPIRYPENRGDE
jgi:hypothetical protein